MIKENTPSKTICISFIGSIASFSRIVNDNYFEGIVLGCLTPDPHNPEYPYTVDSLKRHAFYTVDDILNNSNTPSIVIEYYKLYLKKDIFSNTSSCNHEYINVGFNTIKMICKHCDKEQL